MLPTKYVALFLLTCLECKLLMMLSDDFSASFDDFIDVRALEKITESDLDLIEGDVGSVLVDGIFHDTPDKAEDLPDHQCSVEASAEVQTPSGSCAEGTSSSVTFPDNPLNIVLRSFTPAILDHEALDVEQPPMSLRQIYSGAIKEEIRCKIQLKRINMGEEELRVDYTEPEPTISYEAVNKRNEIREKNKMYAKQSREKAKEFRKRLLNTNKELLARKTTLMEELRILKQKFHNVKESFLRHMPECKEKSRVNHV